jgi:hypothetical protein
MLQQKQPNLRKIIKLPRHDDQKNGKELHQTQPKYSDHHVQKSVQTNPRLKEGKDDELVSTNIRAYL